MEILFYDWSKRTYAAVWHKRSISRYLIQDVRYSLKRIRRIYWPKVLRGSRNCEELNHNNHLLNHLIPGSNPAVFDTSYA